MTKTEYIIKQISKSNKKNFENYVITRIWHRLNNNDIKFITQQYIRRQKGYALTDIYFPQLDLHIEVDEPFHIKKIDLDKNREIDIVEATNHVIESITITDDIKLIDTQVEKLIYKIKNIISKKKRKGKFEPWNLENEFNPKNYIKKGYLEVNENPVFKTILDACNCLGQDYKAVQKAWFKSKKYNNHYLWFPKFYENKEWDNKITSNGLEIIEKCKLKEKQKKHFEQSINHPTRRIVFPRSIDNLGFRLYRFKGIFEIDYKKSSLEGGVFYKRVETKIIIHE